MAIGLFTSRMTDPTQAGGCPLGPHKPRTPGSTPGPATTVVNLRREPYDVYIGRTQHAKGTAGASNIPDPPARGWAGNPYAVDWALVRTMPPDDAREYLAGLIAAYRTYFNMRIERDPPFRAAVLALRGKRLGCFCKPGVCHGDVIAEWVDAQGAA